MQATEPVSVQPADPVTIDNKGGRLETHSPLEGAWIFILFGLLLGLAWAVLRRQGQTRHSFTGPILTALAALFTLMSAASSWFAGEFLFSLATKGHVFYGSDVLHIVELVVGLGGTFAAWLFLWRRRYGWTAVFLAFQFVPLVLATALPASFLDRGVRFRPVDTWQEALMVAMDATRQANLKTGPDIPIFEGGRWVASVRDENGSLTPDIVEIDPVTGKARVKRAVPDPASARWVGLCIRVAASDRRVRNAVLALSSGDPELDKRMQADAIGMAPPHHAPAETWIPLRITANGEQKTGAEAYDGPPLPEINCDHLAKAAARAGARP